MKIILLLALLLLPRLAWAVVDPVGWWKFNEGSGVTAIDSGSGGNNGNLTGHAPTYSAGHIGSNALTFVLASSQYVDVGTGAAVDITGDLTLSAWVNPSTLATVDDTFYSIAGKGYGSSVEQIIFRFSQVLGDPTLDCGVYDTGVEHVVRYIYGANITTGNWYHVACRRDSTTWKIYVNGTEVANLDDTVAPTSNSQKFLIGSQDINGTPSRFFDGIIDDVRLYNRALTPTEITDMYNQTEAGPASTIRRKATVLQ